MTNIRAIGKMPESVGSVPARRPAVDRSAAGVGKKLSLLTGVARSKIAKAMILAGVSSSVPACIGDFYDDATIMACLNDGGAFDPKNGACAILADGGSLDGLISLDGNRRRGGDISGVDGGKTNDDADAVNGSDDADAVDGNDGTDSEAVDAKDGDAVDGNDSDDSDDGDAFEVGPIDIKIPVDLDTDDGDLDLDDAKDANAPDVVDDDGVDVIVDSGPEAGLDAVDNGVDGATDGGTDANSLDVVDGGVDGGTDADSPDVVDGGVDTDGDGIADSSGDVPPDVQPPKMCEGQPDGKIKPFYTGKPGTQGIGECAPGLLQCKDGTWVNIENETVPVPEGKICDGKDNDCDGSTDPDIVSPDGTDVGECQKEVQTCVGVAIGGPYVISKKAIGSAAEICDGLDNDCDGATDEDLTKKEDYPKEWDPKTENVAACKAAVTKCIAGKSVFTPANGPKAETCNGVDDDCNGLIDDNGKGLPLSKTTSFSQYDGIGICQATEEVCDAGKFVITKPGVGPAPKEVYMNGVDDNCNGKIDLEESGGTCDGNADGLVDIEKFDTGFKNAVFAFLGKGPNDKLTVAEADGVTNLYLKNKGLTGIHGIECFRNATSINIGANPIPDLSPLAVLSKAEELFLGNTGTSDISALKGLVYLKTVILVTNPNLKDISALIVNPGIGEGDTVDLTEDFVPANQIAALKAKGVIVLQ